MRDAHIVMQLQRELEWRGRLVRWDRVGSGPAVVCCHGTPWSSQLWAPIARALSDSFTVYLWDMPGYGASSKSDDHPVSLDLQGELFSDLVERWSLSRPHVLAHDFGGTVALRAHLLHRVDFASLGLVDVVALAPWGSDFFRLVHDHADVFAALPPPIHEGVVRSYIEGASATGLSERDAQMLVEPWLGDQGQAAFYRQIAQADERFTDEIEPSYSEVRCPTLVVWGEDDTWIPVDRARRLAAAIPDAELKLIPGAGHLIHLDRPHELTAALGTWLLNRRGQP